VTNKSMLIWQCFNVLSILMDLKFMYMHDLYRLSFFRVSALFECIWFG